MVSPRRSERVVYVWRRDGGYISSRRLRSGSRSAVRKTAGDQGRRRRCRITLQKPVVTLVLFFNASIF